MIAKNCDIPWLLQLQTMIGPDVATVECHHYSDDDTLQLRIHPQVMGKQLTQRLQRCIKHALPPGYAIQVIVPPVRRTDVVMLKGSVSYRHPYYAVEIKCASSVTEPYAEDEPAHF